MKKIEQKKEEGGMFLLGLFIVIIFTMGFLGFWNSEPVVYLPCISASIEEGKGIPEPISDEFTRARQNLENIQIGDWIITEGFSSTTGHKAYYEYRVEEILKAKEDTLIGTRMRKGMYTFWNTLKELENWDYRIMLKEDQPDQNTIKSL